MKTDFKKLVEDNIKIVTIDKPMFLETQYVGKVKISFVVKKIVTLLDKEKISSMKLDVYEKEGSKSLENKKIKEVRYFDFAFGNSLSWEMLNEEPELKENYLEFIQRERIRRLTENIIDASETGKIVHHIFGLCDSCNDCQGHECGSTIYFIEDFDRGVLLG